MAQIDILEQTQSIVRDVVEPDASRVDQEAAWPEPGLRAIQAAGLGGLVAPVSAGGLGYGMLGLLQVCEILGRACPSTGLCFGMHCVGTAAITAKHTDQQHSQLLEPICRGEHLTTLALSEPGTGSHLWLAETQIEHHEQGYRVHGRKAFVTGAGHCDSYVLSAVAAEADAPPGMFSCVVVPSDADGVVWGQPWDGLGMRGNASTTMDLNDVSLPAENLLGEEGEQLWYVFNVIAPYFLMAMTGTYLGIASAALEEARQHMRKRQYSHSGRTVADQPVLQHRLGQLWGEVERTRRLAYHAAAAGDAGEEQALPAMLSAKAEVGQSAVHVANEAMTLCGGTAYREHSRLGQLLRDARAAHVMAPTTDLLWTWVGRSLLDLPLLSD
ncbi:acyl-CoA dehydrogenase family protein [Phycisphaerales bacterium AB-hyl4]|uniref:Acyl-CoA dehydrogenase family protein n=1 Tax=Natronomicrosphaera hydrolytica TaxID=3242702 RepID=A0ABV4U515_9BACT